MFMLEPTMSNIFSNQFKLPPLLVIIESELKYKIDLKFDYKHTYKLLYKVIWLRYKNMEEESD